MGQKSVPRDFSVTLFGSRDLAASAIRPRVFCVFLQHCNTFTCRALPLLWPQKR